jgi:small-conductance mechanosensitive channel
VEPENPATAPATRVSTRPGTAASQPGSAATGPATTRAATTGPAASEPAATQAATQPAAPASRPSSPIPLAEVVARAGAIRQELRATDADLASNPAVRTVREQLPVLTADIASRSEEMGRTLAGNPASEVLRSEEAGWRNIGATLEGWRKDLTSRAESLEGRIGVLQNHATTWQQALAVARAANLPPEVIRQVQDTANAIEATRAEAERRQAEALLLQSQVATQAEQVNTALESIAAHRGELINQMFEADSPPIWSPQVGQDLSGAGKEPSQLPWSAQFAALWTYLLGARDRLLIHLVILGLVTMGMYWARARFTEWAVAEPTLKPAGAIFINPFANAVVLSILLSLWLHPQAPRLFWSFSAAIAIVPAAMLVQRLLSKRYLVLVYGLVVFFFSDQLRTLLLPLPTWPRVVFLVEMIGGIAFLAWFIRTRHEPALGRGGRIGGRRRLAGLVCRATILLMALAGFTAAIGYSKLGYLLGGGVLRSAYVALLLCACVAVAEGVVIILLHLRPISHFAAIRRHMALIRLRVNRALMLAAALYWLYLALRFFLLADPVIAWLKVVLFTQVEIGWFALSLWQVIAAVFTVWASFAVSRFIRFLLEEDVYPHVRLPRGLGNALATIIHYAVLVVGFVMALGFLGFPMTQLTILTGAFGVGLGFGLQQIINNFFSGIIVLAERPIQVGDVIEMDGQIGTVTRIGIRATVMRTLAGSDIILPNGRLIAERVINWTLTERSRGFEMPVNVDSAVPPERVMPVLEAAAKAHPQVSSHPPAVAQLTAFSPAALTFTLRVWTTNVEDWQQVRSEVALAVYAALRKEGIGLK